MPGLSRRLKQLEQELLALGEETMLIEELDGFIAGLLVCPDLIKPGEWLPIVWSRDSGDPQPAFENLDHANRVLELIMEHYNGVARTLMERPDRYGPLFPVGDATVTSSGNSRSRGFEKAIELRPTAWQDLLNADTDTATAMRGMLGLVDVAHGDRRVSRQDSKNLTATAPGSIARWIVTLNEWRLDNHHRMQGPDSIPRRPFATMNKIGRNDPCPCGSGKKYKRCCALH
jgi:uncharacterized protein